MNNNPYRQRLRVLLILYYFSDSISSNTDTELISVFYSEVKIQKIDFLIRYPSYLCYELLRLHYETNIPDFTNTKSIISEIFNNNEPQLKTDEMRRFFYGAYEELDDVISYLSSVNLVVFKQKKNVALKNIHKEYFLTRYAIDKIKNGLTSVAASHWYFRRCSLIKQYFGDLLGSALKDRQYAIEEYRETPLGTYINDIEQQVRNKFHQLFNQTL